MHTGPAQNGDLVFIFISLKIISNSIDLATLYFVYFTYD